MPMENNLKGVILAAPSSGSGKTVITLGMLRALKRRGVDVCAAKAGPDFIDPGFHSYAAGGSSVNLDPWAMSSERLRQLALGQGSGFLVVEAMMGLFDGAVDGTGSAADLAQILGLPVILIVDCAKQSHSVAALVKGFKEFRQDIDVAGVILNKVGSQRHEHLLRDALSSLDVQIFGAVYRNDDLLMPERHLGLVQAVEMDQREAFFDNAADLISQSLDLDLLVSTGRSIGLPKSEDTVSAYKIPPLGQFIAIARDAAFSFCYPHLIGDWKSAGANLSFFSPLADESPDNDCDAIYLPGGYPELHAGRLSTADNFLSSLTKNASKGTTIYGECGGYMVLGQGLTDAAGARHKMAGRLNLETSFEKRKLHLGYRRAKAANFPLGERLNCHEFHYSTVLEEYGEPLFEVEDALGKELGNVGLRDGSVFGSYMHLIDSAG